MHASQIKVRPAAREERWRTAGSSSGYYGCGSGESGSTHQELAKKTPFGGQTLVSLKDLLGCQTLGTVS